MHDGDRNGDEGNGGGEDAHPDESSGEETTGDAESDRERADAQSGPTDDGLAAARSAGEFALQFGLRPLSDLLGFDLVLSRGQAVGGRGEPISTDVDGAGATVDEGVGPADAAGDEGPAWQRTFDDQTTTGKPAHVAARRTDGEFVVTADLPGARAEDLSVGIDLNRSRLVVAVADAVVARVPLPWPEAEATRVRFTNGVLEVRLRPVGRQEE